jgi:hypothetical protein
VGVARSILAFDNNNGSVEFRAVQAHGRLTFWARGSAASGHCARAAIFLEATLQSGRLSGQLTETPVGPSQGASTGLQ